MQQENNIRVLDRALDILECFSIDSQKLSLMELSEKTGLSTSTVHRILGTLEKRDYLNRNDDTKRYSLGPRIVYLANMIEKKSGEDIGNKAIENLVALRDAYDECASLFVREGKYRICIERIESRMALRMVINKGDRFSVIKGGTGKILMMGMEVEELKALLEEDYEQVIKDIERARQQGYWVSNGEREKGLTSIGAPVYNAHGAVIAAMSLSGPTARIIDENLTEKVLAVVREAQDLSKKLGYYGETALK